MRVYPRQMLGMRLPEHSCVTVCPSAIQGEGVFAVRAIESGAVVLRLDDSRIVDSSHPLRVEEAELAIHRDFLPDGTIVLMRPPERYINHSCEPNCFVYSAGRHRFLLAGRDLAAGEELLVDYALNAVDGDDWQCRCGSGNCRGFHKCDFFALPEALQLRNLPFLDPWFAETHSGRIERLLAAGLDRG
jgi:uncharacterized protein